MIKKTLALLWVLCFSAPLARAGEAPLVFTPQDRLLVVAARERDGASGVEGVLERAKASGIETRLVSLVPKRGLLRIWIGRPQKTDVIVRSLEHTLLSFQPTLVLAAAPFDPNFDNQTAPLYLQTALYNLEGQLTPPPRVYVHMSDVPNELTRYPGPEKIVPVPLPADIGSVFKRPLGDADILYEIYDDELWISVPLPASVDEMGVLTLYVFGYKKGFLPSDTPKFSLRLFGNKMFVYDRAKSFHSPDLVYRLDKGSLFIRIPLRLLKEPDALFVSARSAKQERSADFGSWKVIEIA